MSIVQLSGLGAGCDLPQLSTVAPSLASNLSRFGGDLRLVAENMRWSAGVLADFMASGMTTTAENIQIIDSVVDCSSYSDSDKALIKSKIAPRAATTVATTGTNVSPGAGVTLPVNPTTEPFYQGFVTGATDWLTPNTAIDVLSNYNKYQPTLPVTVGLIAVPVVVVLLLSMLLKRR